jgi:hypothetical protein
VSADVIELGGVALIVATAGMIFFYTVSLGAGSPNRHVGDLLGVNTWRVPPVLVIVSGILMTFAALHTLAVLVAIAALAAAAWSLRYPPSREVRVRRNPSARTAPPADHSRGYRGAILLLAVALEVAAFVIAQ